MKYREITAIANCSHGAIYSERNEMLKETQKTEEIKKEKPSEEEKRHHALFSDVMHKRKAHGTFSVETYL